MLILEFSISAHGIRWGVGKGDFDRFTASSISKEIMERGRLGRRLGVGSSGLSSRYQWHSVVSISYVL